MSDEGRTHETGHDDDRLPDDWMEAARGYHEPPPTPTDGMWRAIEEGLEPRALSLEAARTRRAGRWIRPAMAAAAVLVVGIGIGRMTAPDAGPTASGPMAAGPEAARAAGMSPAVRAVALEHLGRSESLLAMVRADARSGRVDGDVGSWGRGLLTETRMLLDSPAGDDPALRTLLEDLELILAQVALLSESEGMEAGRTREELDIIARGMDEQDVLSRIQAVLPAGPETGMTGI